MDVKNAFLHDTLKETVYMVQLPGFIFSTHPNHICSMEKSLYRFWQAPWFDRLSQFIFSLGFMCNKADPSLFVFHQNHTHHPLINLCWWFAFISFNQSKVAKLFSTLATDFAQRFRASLLLPRCWSSLCFKRHLFVSV